MDEVVKKIRTPKGSTQTAAPKAAGAGAAAKTVKAASAAPAAKARAAKAPAARVPVRQPGKAAPGVPAQAASTPVARQAKMVRGSFSMPKDELAVLSERKQACLKDGIEVKKSQLLRVAITLLRELDSARLGQMVAGLPATTARPKKHK